MTTTVPPGLRGVVVTATNLGDVRGDEGFYHYRQYSAVELARTRSFSDVCALMIDGSAARPRRSRAGSRRRWRALRTVPEAVAAALPVIAAAGGTPLTRPAHRALAHRRRAGPPAAVGRRPDHPARRARYACAP